MAYRDLLGREPARHRFLRYSPSCYVMLAGSSAHYSQIAHHNIHFGHKWKGVFDDLITHRRLMSDPSILVTNPTYTEPGLAPPGKQIYYVLFPTPNLDADIDWRTFEPRYREQVFATLEERGYRGFADAVETHARHHTAGLGRPGHGTRIAVRQRPHAAADRPVPARQYVGGQRRLHRFRHRTRRGRAPGPHVRAVGRPAHPGAPTTPERVAPTAHPVPASIAATAGTLKVMTDALQHHRRAAGSRLPRSADLRAAVLRPARPARDHPHRARGHRRRAGCRWTPRCTTSRFVDTIRTTTAGMLAVAAHGLRRRRAAAADLAGPGLRPELRPATAASRRWSAILTAWTAPLLLAPPLFSRDVYAYLAQGRLLAEGYDPYGRRRLATAGLVHRGRGSDVGRDALARTARCS